MFFIFNFIAYKGIFWRQRVFWGRYVDPFLFPISVNCIVISQLKNDIVAFWHGIDMGPLSIHILSLYIFLGLD